MLWDYEGNLDTLLVRDSQGREVPCQILQRGGGYWGHRYDRILIEAAVPAMGYALYVTAQQEEPSRTVSFSNDMRMQFAEEFVLENDLLKVRLNPLDGSLASMVYKPTGREIIDSARSAGLFRCPADTSAEQAFTKASSHDILT